jgi:gluconate 2-dehydrogenase alpha chain
VGALAYWTADAIKTKYLKNPGPLVQAYCVMGDK